MCWQNYSKKRPTMMLKLTTILIICASCASPVDGVEVAVTASLPPSGATSVGAGAPVADQSGADGSDGALPRPPLANPLLAPSRLDRACDMASRAAARASQWVVDAVAAAAAVTAATAAAAGGSAVPRAQSPSVQSLRGAQSAQRRVCARAEICLADCSSVGGEDGAPSVACSQRCGASCVADFTRCCGAVAHTASASKSCSPDGMCSTGTAASPVV